MTNLTRKILPVLLLASACAHAPLPGSYKAAPEPLTAEGAAPVDDRNIGASREGALLDAERNAVRRAAELFLDETARAENYSALEIGLLKTPRIYVARRKVLSEGRDGAYYRVSVRAWVQHDKIASALRGMGLAGPGGAGATAAFVLRGGDKAFAKGFREAFSARSAVVLKEFPFASDPALLAGPDQGLIDAAAAAGAELLYCASASAASSGSGIDTGFHPARSEASLKVYETKTGREMLSLSGQANAIDAVRETALSKALAAAGELLGQEAAGTTARLVRSETPFRIKVRGVQGLEAAEKLRDQLQRVDLSGLRLESLEDGLAAFLAVPRSADPQEFASAVLRGDPLGLELEAAGQRELVFSLPR